MLFKDRIEAGDALADRLMHYAGRADVLALGLPRGGVPVAFEVAKALDAPLDVFIVRKLGVPDHEELAMGAIATGGVRIVNEEIVNRLHISHQTLDAVTATETKELARREHAYRGQCPPPEMQGRTAILVDDGMATGSTMRAAATALRKQHPGRIVVGVPVAAAQTCDEFRSEVDEMICVATPEPFYGVGRWYQNFSQTTDEEVHHLLEQAGYGRPDAARPGAMSRKP